MKDRFFKNIDTGEVVSASKEGLEAYRRGWEEQKRIGAIPEDSSDYHAFITPHKDELIYQGLAYLENNDDYEEVKK